MAKSKILPRLVASDIGGTLLSGGKQLPAFTAAVLNRLVNDGVPVALITGYNYGAALKFTRNLDEKVLLLPQNGTLCIREKQLVWEYRIPEYAANELFEYLNENDLPAIVYKGRNEDFKTYYVHQTDIPELAYGFQRLDRLNGFENITGISTLLPDGAAIKARETIESIIGDRFKVIYTREFKGSWLEVVHADVRKDLGLKRLCEELSIPLSEVVYFGDNFNDLEALRIAGHPVLVENAAPELKNEFDTIISSVHEQGVAHYLNQCFQLNMHPM
jgi:Cof subfamily protein (haloacid dehalogenase superfamily)